MGTGPSIFSYLVFRQEGDSLKSETTSGLRGKAQDRPSELIKKGFVCINVYAHICFYEVIPISLQPFCGHLFPLPGLKSR